MCIAYQQKSINIVIVYDAFGYDRDEDAGFACELRVNQALQGAVDNVSGCCDLNEQEYYENYHHDPLEERVTIGSEYRSEWRLFWDGANISTMFVGDTGVQLTTLNKRK